MKLRLKHDPQDRENTLIELDGHDLTRCVQEVRLEMGVADAPRVVISAIAADIVDAEIEVGDAIVVEKVYRIAHEDSDLTNTPVRELLATYEEKPEDVTTG